MIRKLSYAGFITVLFHLSALSSSSASPNETVLYSFQGDSDGGDVYSGLVKVGALLYGSTLVGGTGCKASGGCGTIFSIDPVAHVTKQLYRFQGGSKDGQGPFASLLRIGSELYGTTASGGTGSCGGGDATGCGTVFSYNIGTGRETIVHSFVGGSSDGANAQSPLLRVGNTVYGNTIAGGSKNGGTVFSIDLSTNSERVLHAFGTGSDGHNPLGRLVLFNGLLFGTTYSGGPNKCSGSCGTIFSVDPKSGKENVVYAFRPGSTGWNPIGGVVALGNKLYGTTYWGGNGQCGLLGCGTVYSLDPATNTYADIYTFKDFADGSSPDAGLIAVNGNLYGTTQGGGVNNAGTIFSVNPATGRKTLIYSFPGGTGGFNPQASLLHAGGHFYGTTVGQGDDKCSGACGTVFTFTP